MLTTNGLELFYTRHICTVRQLSWREIDIDPPNTPIAPGQDRSISPTLHVSLCTPAAACVVVKPSGLISTPPPIERDALSLTRTRTTAAARSICSCLSVRRLARDSDAVRRKRQWSTADDVVYARRLFAGLVYFFLPHQPGQRKRTGRCDSQQRDDGIQTRGLGLFAPRICAVQDSAPALSLFPFGLYIYQP